MRRAWPFPPAGPFAASGPGCASCGAPADGGGVRRPGPVRPAEPAASVRASEPMPAPSGRQIRLVHGEQEAWVTEVGAGLRAYQVDGAPVLDGYPETEMCSGGRGQVLMPWPNRLGDGRF